MLLSTYRPSLMFSLGILLAAGLSVSVDGTGLYALGQQAQRISLDDGNLTLPAARRALQPADLAAARTAWVYFANNTQAATGLVDGTQGFASTTMWDQGSYLLALVSARRLQIISADEFSDRLGRLLESLERLQLFEGKLPNKVYDTGTLDMVDYDNKVSPEGVGWSALDISRLLLALRVAERHFPAFGDQIRRLLRGWDLAAMARDGELIGATRSAGQTEYSQEGRLGYEQYAARSAAMWGLDVGAAMSAARSVSWRDISGIAIPVDRRTHTSFGAITPTLSEPYMLLGLELGFDRESAQLASQIYQVQERRFRETGIATAVSEDHIDHAPWFLYGTVNSNGQDWAVLTDKGVDYTDLRTVSLKAVFGWDALYHTDYTAGLRKALEPLLADPETGWLAGQYEATGLPNRAHSLNTNAVVLEAVQYIANGPLWEVAE